MAYIEAKGIHKTFGKGEEQCTPSGGLPCPRTKERWWR